MPDGTGCNEGEGMFVTDIIYGVLAGRIDLGTGNNFNSLDIGECPFSMEILGF